MKDIYINLAHHLSKLPMSIAYSEELVEMLRLHLTTLEAQVAIGLPNDVVPLNFVSLDGISDLDGLSKDKVIEVLDSLSEKGVVYTGKTSKGAKGYALCQRGFGFFNQSVYWKGEDTSHVRKMTELLDKYIKDPNLEKLSFLRNDTKPFRYVPVSGSIDTKTQGVYSQHMMEEVIQNARSFAVGHCPCRMKATMLGEGCDHPTEVCIKFNDMADFLTDKGFARKIDRDEALEIVKKSAEAGLIHFVDNAGGDVQHNCNCCGCSCWNLSPIKKRKVPRDVIMATYFIRETDPEACIGCGECVDICPVDAIKIEDDLAVVDEKWCVGCGVCATVCPAEALTLKIRSDKTGDLPAENFRELHEMILKEKNLDSAS
jgi:H+/Na+-translocating ferredoxin:NAD+ oxidoreductase subunit B